MGQRAFSIAMSVEDPLTAERLLEALKKGELDAFARPGGAASSSPLDAASPGFWDIFVPAEALTKAQGIIEDVLADDRAHATENAQAAEEEACPEPVEGALSSENLVNGEP